MIWRRESPSMMETASPRKKSPRTRRLPPLLHFTIMIPLSERQTLNEFAITAYPHCWAFVHPLSSSSDSSRVVRLVVRSTSGWSPGNWSSKSVSSTLRTGTWRSVGSVIFTRDTSRFARTAADTSSFGSTTFPSRFSKFRSRWSKGRLKCKLFPRKNFKSCQLFHQSTL